MRTSRRTRGRPPLDAAAEAHAPRLTIRVPDGLRRRVADRAAAEGVRLSDAVRDALERWTDEPSLAVRREVRRLMRLSDVEREAVFLASNENVRRLLTGGSS